MLIVTPPLSLTQGKPFAQTWRIEDPLADPPDVPLAGWTGSVRLFRKPFSDTFYSANLVMESDRIVLEIPAATTADFTALPYVGGRANGWYQIDLTSPEPSQSQVWQGSVSVAGAVE